jgi:hypothetical protein
MCWLWSTAQEQKNASANRTTHEWRQIGRTLSQTLTRTLADAEDADITIRLLETNDSRLTPVETAP